MKPVIIGNATLHHGDCLAAMRLMPDNAFDLAIVDPPYGIGVNTMNMGGRQTIRPDARKWDDEIPPQTTFPNWSESAPTGLYGAATTSTFYQPDVL